MELGFLDYLLDITLSALNIKSSKSSKMMMMVLSWTVEFTKKKIICNGDKVVNCPEGHCIQHRMP